jgi:hypothetical protein
MTFFIASRERINRITGRARLPAGRQVYHFAIWAWRERQPSGFSFTNYLSGKVRLQRGGAGASPRIIGSQRRVSRKE